MKFAYILESDERIQKELFQTLKSLDANLLIRFFYKLEDFQEWMNLALREGRSALNLGGHPLSIDTGSTTSTSGDDELTLLIASTDILGVKNLSLLKRAKLYFIRQKICLEENPTSFLLTTFEDLDLSMQPADELIVSNVIYKPFDMLILKQHLEYALLGRKPLTSSTIAPLKINETIEMLKSVKVTKVSEIGFRMQSRTEIPVGSVTKYYSDYFGSDTKSSIFAVCTSSTPISAKEFQCDFNLFATDNKQISKIRRNIFANKKNVPVEVKNDSSEDFNILILDTENKLALDLRTILFDTFTNAKIYIFNNHNQLLSDLNDKESPQRKVLPAKFDLVSVNSNYLQGEKEDSWSTLCLSLLSRASKHGIYNFKNPDLIMHASQVIPDSEMKGLGRWVRDVFYMPFDKVYIQKKIVTLFPQAVNKMPVAIGSIEEAVVMKVANPVEITEISEAGLILRYHQALAVGTFGEFYLLRKGEQKAPEIIGAVNYSAPEKDSPESFLNHFIFFGMKDIFLQHIRLWLREAYISAKGKK